MTNTDSNGRRGFWIFLAGGLAGALVVLLWVRPWSLSSGLEPAPPPSELGASGQQVTAVESIETDASASALPYAIAGRVVDQTGSPISGARLVLYDEAQQTRATAESGRDGHFELPDLGLGLYTIEASAVAYSGHSRAGITPAGPPLELRLEAFAELVGRVVHAGEGVAGATVLVGGPGLYPPLRSRSGPDGTFALGDLGVAGALEFVVLTETHGSGFGTRVALSEQARVEISLEVAPVLRVAVSDAGGAAIADGVISVSGGPIHVLSVSEPIREGLGEVKGLPSGGYYVRIRAAGFLPWEGRLRHETDGDPRHQVTLEPGTALSGRVLDPAGRAVSGARLSATVQDGMGRRWRLAAGDGGRVGRLVRADGTELWARGEAVSSGEGGVFRLSGLPGGRAVLMATAEGFNPFQSAVMQVDGVSEIPDIEIRLVAPAE